MRPRSPKLLLLCSLPAVSLCLQQSQSQQRQQQQERVSLGTLPVAPIAFGTLNHFDNDIETAALILQQAPPGTLVDTAELYGGGNAETTLGKAIQQNQAKKGEGEIYVATKFAPSLLRKTSKDMASVVVEACRASANRLGRDKIDLYQLHYSDALILRNVRAFGISSEILPDQDEQYWDGLARAYEQGVAANVGVCNYGPTMIRRAHAALEKRGVPLVSNQINYNLMRYKVSEETKRVCDELGIQVLAYHPLGKGALTGKYKAEIKSQMPEAMGLYYRMKNYLRGTVELRAALAQIAAQRGDDKDKTTTNMSQVAINWITCQGAIPICGARTPEQAAWNAGSMGWSLSPAELSLLDDAAAKSLDRYTPLGKEFELV
jgi:pyridoxine 4-dehydrogenase